MSDQALSSIAQTLAQMQATKAALVQHMEANWQAAAMEIGILREQAKTQTEAFIATSKAQSRRGGVVDVKRHREARFPQR